MFILLEGPDGAGKTTIAKELQARLNAIYIHNGPAPVGEAFKQWNAVVDLARKGATVICDRLHWGDAVYAERFRPEVGRALNSAQFGYLESEINRCGGTIVHVTADLPTLVERYDGEYIEIDDISAIMHSYARLDASTQTFSHLQINTTKVSTETAVEAIITMAKDNHAHAHSSR